MKNIFILVILSFFVLAGVAQEKTLKLKDVYTNPEVYPNRVSALQWIPGENSYSYIEDNKMMSSAFKGRRADKPIITLEKINEDWKKAGLKEQKRFPSLSWSDKNEFRFVNEDKLYIYNIKSGEIAYKCNYPQSSEYIKRNPAKADMVAYTKGQNLFINKGEVEIAVSNDTIDGIVNGQTVARSEFGITHGIFWSPKGNLLAYYKKDETMVSNYPLVNTTTRVATVENTRYAMAGMETESVDVWVFNPESKKNIMLDNSNFKGEYLTNVTWSPNEEFIYIQVLNRGQDHMKLNKYNAKTGEFEKTLFEEKHEKWVEPEEELHFLNNDNENFVFMSERDGYYHAYLYNTDGKMIKQLTKGDWVITSFEGFNASNTKMYFMATKESPIERHLYELDMKSLEIKKLTSVEGTHNITLNESKTYAFDTYSNYKEIAREYSLLSISKAVSVKIIKKNKNPFENFKMGEMTIDKIKANDGTDLYYRLIKPVDFDASKKYPVLVYVYGGPHAQMINNTFLGGGGYFLQAMAAKGYVIFTVDNRGSGNRGFAFENAIHRQLGVLEMQDQMSGIEFLKTLDFVDMDRIGVDGWSYGGFMTTSLMLNHNDVFKVGVAGGPVIDWKYYEIMYGERYMDTPEENPEGYKNSCVLEKVDSLTGQLLIIHGTMDPTVVWQHSLQLLKVCVDKQKQIDYFVYPGHGHNVRGMNRLHLENKIAKYFDDYL